MAGDLVLMTGATGFLGYLTLIDLLKHGYRIRAAVRSMTKAEGTLSAPTLKSLSPTSEQLSFVSVPDMSAPGAFDDAIQGVKYVIHLAASIPSWGEGEQNSSILEKQFISTCERGAIEILEAAATKSHGTVKRVVMTSTTGAILPLPVVSGLEQVEAYLAAKKTALLASEAFVRDQKPLFDLITVVPPWIWARDELSKDKETILRSGSNVILLSLVTGKQFGFGVIGNAAYGEDVARAHVVALDPDVPGNRKYVINREIVWNDAITMAKQLYPEAFEDGRLKAGNCLSFVIKWDISETENELRIKPQSLETMIQSVVGQYLELLDKEVA
ncbi:reductase [Trichoderma harzianum]|uniref:Reductase n=1 Tax=Trichoderma harzianum TaxID=5544 RepID=A0A0F9ZY26_TRIHA|nr:reductase [Trichoderma harzianum]